MKRLPEASGFAEPILLCNNDHRFLVREELERAGIKPKAIVLEPIARNTAPAIAVAALAALAEDPGAVLAVMPSDHVIRNEARFLEAVRQAARIASTGKLVLFGIVPDEPHTGYGYIRKGGLVEGMSGQAFTVASFTEKPDADTAARYLADGGYYWNSGIFVLHARTYIDELARLEPKILEAAKAAWSKAEHDLGFLRLDRAAFAASPSISVDYAVMEKTGAAAMLPIDVGWNDVGSWSSLWDIAPRDQEDNFVHGDAVLTDTTGSYVHSERSVVATIGVHDLVIVDTPDALLVADRSRAHDVSKIVARLRELNRREHEQHVRNYRPWGFFETLNIAPHGR